MLLYKTKEVKLCCCSKFCVLRFKKGNYNAGARFEMYWRWICIILYALEVLVTIIDLVLTETAESPSGIEARSEISEDYTLDII